MINKAWDEFLYIVKLDADNSVDNSNIKIIKKAFYAGGLSIFKEILLINDDINKQKTILREFENFLIEIKSSKVENNDSSTN